MVFIILNWVDLRYAGLAVTEEGEVDIFDTREEAEESVSDFNGTCKIIEIDESSTDEQKCRRCGRIQTPMSYCVEYKGACIRYGSEVVEVKE